MQTGHTCLSKLPNGNNGSGKTETEPPSVYNSAGPRYSGFRKEARISVGAAPDSRRIELEIISEKISQRRGEVGSESKGNGGERKMRLRAEDYLGAR